MVGERLQERVVQETAALETVAQDTTGGMGNDSIGEEARDGR